MSRVQDYFNARLDAIAAQSVLAGTVANPGDIGTNREQLLLDFIKGHLPSRLRSGLGGMVIGANGAESGQVDILVSNDLGLRFDDNARTFVVAESVAAAISVKSMLDSKAIENALNNLASIPDPDPELLTFPQLRPGAFEAFLRYHPTKIVFGFQGMQPEATRSAVEKTLKALPDQHHGRFSVVVSGSHLVTCHPDGAKTRDGNPIDAGAVHLSVLPAEHRGRGLVQIIDRITKYVSHLAFMQVSVQKHLEVP